MIYTDIAKIKLTEKQLVICPISFNELDDPDDTHQSIYCQVAIDSDVGLVGFQMYFKMPKVDEMVDFMTKIYKKFSDSPIDEGTHSFSKGKWIVMPNNQATQPRLIAEVLKKLGFRGIILPNE